MTNLATELEKIKSLITVEQVNLAGQLVDLLPKPFVCVSIGPMGELCIWSSFEHNEQQMSLYIFRSGLTGYFVGASLSEVKFGLTPDETRSGISAFFERLSNHDPGGLVEGVDHV